LNGNHPQVERVKFGTYTAVTIPISTHPASELECIKTMIAAISAMNAGETCTPAAK